MVRENVAYISSRGGVTVEVRPQVGEIDVYQHSRHLKGSSGVFIRTTKVRVLEIEIIVIANLVLKDAVRNYIMTAQQPVIRLNRQIQRFRLLSHEEHVLLCSVEAVRDHGGENTACGHRHYRYDH